VEQLATAPARHVCCAASENSCFASRK
jgi:hypothetical protein